MPVRSLSSSVLRWPEQQQVHRAAVEWARRLMREHHDVERIGYAGSYARGDWGVGSDVDLIILVEAVDAPFIERARRYDATELPVPADILVYSKAEWLDMTERGGALRPVVWVG